MPKHLRKLLLLAALCWVVPVSAQQRPASFNHQDRDGPACPKARAQALALAQAQAAQSGGATTVIVVRRNDSIGEAPTFGARRAFQP